MTRMFSLLICSALLFAACTPTGKGLSVAPSFNGVSVQPNSVTTSGIVTRTRLDNADADWHYYRDHQELSPDDCYDMVVAPNGVERYIAYITKTTNGKWKLAVRSGVGNAIWSTSDAHIDINVEPDESDFSFHCLRPRITHLTGGIYGIAWFDNSKLHTATFTPSKPVGSELVLGPVNNFDFGEMSAKNISLVYFNATPHLIWVPPNRDRILIRRGTLNGHTLNINNPATFSSINSESHSDVITRNDGLYIAISQAGSITLLKAAGSGTAWEEVASCPSDRTIKNNLLYVDQNGDTRVLISGYAITNERTLNFSDCSTQSLQIGIGAGYQNSRITYFPGT